MGLLCMSVRMLKMLRSGMLVAAVLSNGPAVVMAADAPAQPSPTPAPVTPTPAPVSPVATKKTPSPELLAAVAKERGVRDGKDAKAAFAEYKRLAESGEMHACFHLGQCYVEGIGVEKNPKEAAVWLGKSAASGDMSAKALLGFRLMQGGVRHLKRAESLLAEASRAGVVYADVWLGIGYGESSTEVMGAFGADTRRARFHLKKAAEAGSLFAQSALGLELSSCDPKDFDGAFRWHKLAAESGHSLSCVHLAQLYMKGRGVEVDMTESYAWLLAARNAPVSRISEAVFQDLMKASRSLYSGVDEKVAETKAANFVKGMKASRPLGMDPCDCGTRIK